MTDSRNLSQQDWQQQEGVIAQFEAAFQQGASPQIEQFLPQEGIDRFTLLVELVHTDLEQRLNAGESVCLEDYLKRFPELKEDDDSLQELIAAESDLRIQKTPKVDVAETIIRSEDSTQSQIANRSTLPPADSLEQDQHQKEYGRYVVKKLLGAGAFGQVFLAHDPKTKRDVALKVPKWQLQPGSEEDERFLREARAVAALQHQHICPLFDLLETDDRIVLVMPYIAGGSLAEKINQRKYSLNKSVRLVRILASAMTYAHDAGVVHRDLKPANILIDEKHSKPVITDFGLALRNDINETTLTQKGQLLGTPAYMSPEQAGAEIDKIGFASDIYSLGIILYELCTGQLPFTGSITQVIGQILTKEPAAPSSISPDISPQLEQIILKAIAKKSEDRFRSMKEFAAALKSLQTVGNRIEAAEPTIGERDANSFSKWWIVAGIAVVFLAAGSWAFFKPNISDTELKDRVSQKPAVPFEQIDLLKEIQLPNHVVVGDWSINTNGVTVSPGEFSRLSIPVQTAANYQLELELTRKLGIGEVNLIFPVGSRSCMLSLGQNDWCGLELPYGNRQGQQIPGHLSNNQRHKLLLKVTTENSQADIKAELNGSVILNWQGTLESLSLRSDWQVQPHSFGLGADQGQAIFHKMILFVEKNHQVSRNHWMKHKTEKYQQPKDLLEEINPSQHAFRGSWKLAVDKQELSIDSGNDFATLILPVVPTGSYQLQIEMTRTQGNGEINLILPVGDVYCMISFGLDNDQFGIQHVNGRYWDMRKPGLFINNKKQVIQVDVILEQEDRASIRFQIDKQEIFHWKGNCKDLTLREMWQIYPKALGLGVDQDAIQFHNILFQSKTGEVYRLKRE